MRISARKMDQSRGFDGLPEAQQDYVREVAEGYGISMSSLRNTFLGRWEFNVKFHLGMAATCNGRLFKNRIRSMFAYSHDKDGYDPEPLKMYFATVLHTKHHNIFLNEQGIRNRLLSYAFLKDCEPGFLTEYLKTGMPSPTNSKPRKTTLKVLNSESYRVKRAQSVIAKLSRNAEI